MDAQCGETSFYVFSACIYCTAGLITVGSLSFCCKLLNKNYFQKKKKKKKKIKKKKKKTKKIKKK